MSDSRPPADAATRSASCGKRAACWFAFDELKDPKWSKYVRCKFCGTLMIYGDGNTTSLMKHVRTAHKEQLDEHMQKSAGSASAVGLQSVSFPRQD